MKKYLFKKLDNIKKYSRTFKQKMNPSQKWIEKVYNRGKVLSEIMEFTAKSLLYVFGSIIFILLSFFFKKEDRTEGLRILTNGFEESIFLNSLFIFVVLLFPFFFRKEFTKGNKIFVFFLITLYGVSMIIFSVCSVFFSS